MGFLHAMREGEEMYGYPVGSQGFTQIAQEGSQFLHMLNHLVGNRDIEPPRRIPPTGIPRDDANARLPIDTGMPRGQQINGSGHMAIILEPIPPAFEAIKIGRTS